MSDNLEFEKKIKEHSNILAKLGTDLAKSQFSYKVEKKKSKEYWIKRIADVEKYNEKGLEYYNEIYSMMNMINKEESQMFLLRIGKFRQLGLELIEIMEKIRYLDPPGFASRNMRECLIAQLRIFRDNQLAMQLLTDYFEDFAKHRYDKIISNLKCSEKDLKEAMNQAKSEAEKAFSDNRIFIENGRLHGQKIVDRFLSIR